MIVYGAWSAFVGLMGMVTFIANFINKYTCIFNGKSSRIILTAMYARKVAEIKDKKVMLLLETPGFQAIALHRPHFNEKIIL